MEYTTKMITYPGTYETMFTLITRKCYSTVRKDGNTVLEIPVSFQGDTVGGYSYIHAIGWDYC